MAAMPQPVPGGAATPAPSQAPANPKQILLAQLYQMAKRLAQQDPALSAGLEKAAAGIQEAQSAMVMQPQSQPAGSNPPL